MRPYFLQRIRQRGDAYFFQGKVELQMADGHSVRAFVRGTRRYGVSLELKGNKVAMSCDCPYNADGFGDCKHVWGVILACSEQGLWEDVEGLSPDLHKSQVDEDEDLAEGVGEEEDQPFPRPQPLARRASNAQRPVWRDALKWAVSAPSVGNPGHPLGAEESMFYVVGTDPSGVQGGILLQLLRSYRKKGGQWSKMTPLKLGDNAWPVQVTPLDKELFGLLRGFKPAANSFFSYSSSANQNQASSQYRLSAAAARQVLPLACSTGRCLYDSRITLEDALTPLTWDGEKPWSLRLHLAPARKEEGFHLTGLLHRGKEQLALDQTKVLKGSGLVLAGDKLLRLENEKDELWVKELGAWGFLTVPQKEADDFLESFYARPVTPPDLDLPEELKPQRRKIKPQPRLLLAPAKGEAGETLLWGDLSFDYEGLRANAENTGVVLYQAKKRILWERDQDAEREQAAKLVSLGFQLKSEGTREIRYYWEISGTRLPEAVVALVRDGWHVEARGKLYRSGANLTAKVTSGLDWFELKLSGRFENVEAPVEALLEALRKGQKTVLLDDGTYGILPEEWLAKWGMVSRMGKEEKEGLRFKENQVGLLDTLLAAQPEILGDKTFQAAREKLQQFEGVKPVNPQGDFRGVLRPYQREGLGWLQFLREFGFGGCLADDMGLGKTVQVLALLENRRFEKGKLKDKKTRREPSLVVVPKSLIFNWMAEAAKFTPGLRLLDHTSIHRSKAGENFSDYDLILTTYGTLRRDASWLASHTFDYVILDEAHVIKNPRSQSAKAARLLKGNHRLALTGTPVQNNLDELWSLFEFLNPGMLGASKAMDMVSGMEPLEKEGQTFLSRALRPFFLRRTKDIVAKDLPAKTEQVLFCDMDASQRSLYDGLRKHYRDALMEKVESQGLNKSKMHVLEALLRLRQVACHPGLVDSTQKHLLGAKLEMLIPQLQEVFSEGHKVLVFSQFTSFLSIFKKHLAPLNLKMAYLDGKSRDREEQVKRFQEDDQCKLFLISLKAGGLGLNLTSADYVYLLDPWWNPAVEAQAMDRAHRIGQTRHVFAYRLITRGTVEEKILEMQAKKRKLAKAVFGSEKGFLSGLKREELEWLLS